MVEPESNDMIHFESDIMIRTKDLKFLKLPENIQTKDFQRDELIKLKVVSDALLKEWLKTGKLNDRFHQVSKNLITLTDKMRKQDEGIKIHQDLSMTQNQFREIVEAEFKIIEKETKDV